MIPRAVCEYVVSVLEHARARCDERAERRLRDGSAGVPDIVAALESIEAAGRVPARIVLPSHVA